MAILPSLDVLALTVLAHGDHGTAVAAENVDLVIFFLIGLLAGAHCIGMCGPIVTTYTDRLGSQVGSRRADTLTMYEVRQHALFNLGRTFSYAFLGALFAFVGAVAFASVDTVSAVGDTVRGTTGILVGIAIIFSGLYYLRGQAGIPHGVPIIGGVVNRLFGFLTRQINRLATSPGIMGLGAIHGLLPCPIIYPAYLYAFTLGDPIRGAVSLGALGLGTIPILFAYGSVLGSIGLTTRVRLHRALGAGFLVLGYIPLQHGLMLFGIHLPHPPLPFYQPL